MKTNPELLKQLEDLAKRTGSTIDEINEMARMMAQAKFDPLPPDRWGERFEYSKQRMVSLLPNDDFSFVYPQVPKPDADVNLQEAWEVCLRDMRTIAHAYQHEDKLPFDKCFLTFRIQWDWTRFWSVRHWDPKEREREAKRLPELDASAKETVSRVNALLRKQGVYPLPGPSDG